MPENQDPSLLSPSLPTLTPSQQHIEREPQEIEATPKLPAAATSLSTTPTVSPSTSPRLRTPAPLDQSSDTETETETRNMSSYSKYPQDSSSKQHSSKSKSKAKAKNDNWTEVSEPEERRRIQNRIAQRKFRTRINPSTSSYFLA